MTITVLTFLMYVESFDVPILHTCNWGWRWGAEGALSFQSLCYLYFWARNGGFLVDYFLQEPLNQFN